jgi:hypothetical protein
MYKSSNDPQALMTAAIQHKIAGDTLLICSQGRQKLPVRAAIFEQYAKSTRLALMSFAAQKKIKFPSHHLIITLLELFALCEFHGLELQNTSDFCVENFERLLVSYDEESGCKFIIKTASYTADLIWPKMYTAHFIEAIQSIVAPAISQALKPTVRNADRYSPFAVGDSPLMPDFEFAIGQPGPACFPGLCNRASE